MKERNIPNRTCIACREMKPKMALLRIVKQADGKIFVDATGKADGRGAYICNCHACISKLKKLRLLNRVWKMNLPQAVYEQIEEVFIAKK